MQQPQHRHATSLWEKSCTKKNACVCVVCDKMFAEHNCGSNNSYNSYEIFIRGCPPKMPGDRGDPAFEVIDPASATVSIVALGATSNPLKLISDIQRRMCIQLHDCHSFMPAAGSLLCLISLALAACSASPLPLCSASTSFVLNNSVVAVFETSVSCVFPLFPNLAAPPWSRSNDEFSVTILAIGGGGGGGGAGGGLGAFAV